MMQVTSSVLREAGKESAIRASVQFCEQFGYRADVTFSRQTGTNKYGKPFHDDFDTQQLLPVFVRVTQKTATISRPPHAVTDGVSARSFAHRAPIGRLALSTTYKQLAPQATVLAGSRMEGPTLIGSQGPSRLPLADPFMLDGERQDSDWLPESLGSSDQSQRWYTPDDVRGARVS